MATTMIGQWVQSCSYLLRVISIRTGIIAKRS
jgi:hypothetical protein